jgi:hypothetical protein
MFGDLLERYQLKCFSVVEKAGHEEAMKFRLQGSELSGESSGR